MRVLQINSVFQFGSTGRITEELYCEFKEQGIEPTVICTNLEDKEKGVFKVGTKIEGKIHALLTRLTGLRGYFSYFTTMNIKRKINAINPDIIILHNLHNNYVHVPKLLKFIAKRNIKTIWVLHDCWAYTGGCMHYTIYGCDGWLNGCPKCKHSQEALSSWLFCPSAKLFKDRIRGFGAINDFTIVGVSDWITKEAQRSLLKKASKRIRRIYNWIDLDTFCPRNTVELRKKHQIPESGFVVLGAAQIWGEDKGLSHFINVANALPDVTFLIIGKLPYEVSGNIIPIGVISDVQELAEYYSLADVFVNFTQQETFGKVTAEAMACGTPVVINNNTACPEVVGNCGFIIDNNDETACIEAIKHIESVGKSFYSDKCVKRVNELFSKDLIMKQWNSLLNEIYNS